MPLPDLPRYRDWAPTRHDRRGHALPDRADWLVLPTLRTRDSDALEQANFAAALAALAALTALDPDGTSHETHRFTHWGPGWVEIILAAPRTVSETMGRELAARLNDYPVLDDDLHDELLDAARGEQLRGEIPTWTIAADETSTTIHGVLRLEDTAWASTWAQHGDRWVLDHADTLPGDLDWPTPPADALAPPWPHVRALTRAVAARHVGTHADVTVHLQVLPTGDWRLYDDHTGVLRGCIGTWTIAAAATGSEYREIAERLIAQCVAAWAADVL